MYGGYSANIGGVEEYNYVIVENIGYFSQPGVYPRQAYHSPRFTHFRGEMEGERRPAVETTRWSWPPLLTMVSEVQRLPDRILGNTGTAATRPRQRQLSLCGVDNQIPAPGLPILFGVLKQLLAYFAPGLVLALFFYFLAPTFITGSASNYSLSVPDSSFPHHSLSSSSPNHSQCSSLLASCHFPIDQLLTMNSQCDHKNSEYHERIQVLEGELQHMRHQCSAKLTQKEIKFRMLVQAVVNFRSERLFVSKSALFQCLVCVVVLITSYLFARWYFM